MTISLMKLMMEHHLETLVVCSVVRRKETVCLMNQKRYATRMEYSVSSLWCGGTRKGSIIHELQLYED